MFTSQLAKAKKGYINDENELIKLTNNAHEFISRLNNNEL
jgi:hypothetical protein